MANNTGGFGLRTVTTTGNTPATSGQSNYKIESGLDVGIFKNNPVSLNDGGATAGETGYLQDMSFDVTDDGGAGGVDTAGRGMAAATPPSAGERSFSSIIFAEEREYTTVAEPPAEQVERVSSSNYLPDEPDLRADGGMLSSDESAFDTADEFDEADLEDEVMMSFGVRDPQDGSVFARV